MWRSKSESKSSGHQRLKNREIYNYSATKSSKWLFKWLDKIVLMCFKSLEIEDEDSLWWPAPPAGLFVLPPSIIQKGKSRQNWLRFLNNSHIFYRDQLNVIKQLSDEDGTKLTIFFLPISITNLRVSFVWILSYLAVKKVCDQRPTVCVCLSEHRHSFCICFFFSFEDLRGVFAFSMIH